MATFTEMQRQYVGIVRQVRKTYRTADTAGEKLERELDRLIKRKRLLQPDDLKTAVKLYLAYDMAVGAISKAFANAQQYFQTPVQKY
jgi:hypothetical protein